LVGAWWWSVAALVAWSSVEIAASLSAGGTSAVLAPLRVAAITLGLCPAVALVGAKRPQHKAWHFVVLSLWGIVALPAVETLFLHRGQGVQMADARGWFLWILIGLGPINFVPTRYGLASLVFAAGQVVAFSPHLALLRQPLFHQPESVGLLIAVAALVITWFGSRRTSIAASGYDRLWLDFRDTFGLLWGLRAQERVNAAAKQYGWDLELGWTGFRKRSADIPPTEFDSAVEPTLRTTFKGLLRRFVTNQWIVDRL
jgi:hypothetical protein